MKNIGFWLIENVGFVLTQLAIFLFLLSSSCGSNPTVSPIKQVYVYQEVFLNSSQALNLVNPPYWIYYQGGVKGLIIYRDAPNSFIAFERNCTYQPDNKCARVKVHSSGFYMIDTCCGSTFDWQGNVTGSPASVRLLRYATSVPQPNRLLITN